MFARPLRLRLRRSNVRRRVKWMRSKWMGWSRKIRRKRGKKILNISQIKEEGEVKGEEKIKKRTKKNKRGNRSRTKRWKRKWSKKRRI